MIIANTEYAMRLSWHTVLEKIYLEVNVFVDGRWRCAGYPVAVQGHASRLPHSWAPLLAPIYPSSLTEGDTCLWFSPDRSRRLLSAGFWSHRRVPMTVTNHFKRFTTRRTAEHSKPVAITMGLYDRRCMKMANNARKVGERGSNAVPNTT